MNNATEKTTHSTDRTVLTGRRPITIEDLDLTAQLVMAIPVPVPGMDCFHRDINTLGVKRFQDHVVLRLILMISCQRLQMGQL